jgi:hypothetical protein
LFDDDGLPVLSNHAQTAEFSVKKDEFPPFPLEHLMGFFNSVNNSEKVGNNGNNGVFTRPNAQYLTFLLLLFIIPGFFLKGRTGSPPKGHSGGQNKHYGKHGRKDINWRMKLQNKSRIHKRIRKDA